MLRCMIVAVGFVLGFALSFAFREVAGISIAPYTVGFTIGIAAVYGVVHAIKRAR